MDQGLGITVSKERLERMLRQLTLVSVQEFDHPAATIELEEEDDFGVVEASLNVLSRELGDAARQNSELLARMTAAKAELEAKLATIEAQQQEIATLSAPVIEVWDDIVTLPVVGVVDAQRSVDMTERLLERIVATRARCVIVDVTGVELVDTTTAEHLVRMLNAAKLLGVYCVMTGISPTIAQLLTQAGVNLDGVVTLRSLKEGLKSCFHFLG